MRQWRFKFIMKKALFFPSYFGGGFGHISRCLVLSNGLREYGWSTAMVLAGKHVRVVKKNNCEVFNPWFPKRPNQKHGKLLGYLHISDTSYQVIRDGFTAPWRLWAAVSETLHFVDKYKPDVLIGDLSLLTYIIGQITKLPVVQIIRSIMHPSSPKIIWWTKPLEGAMPPDIHPVYDNLMRRWDISPLNLAEDLFQGDLYLIPSIPELEPMSGNQENTYYIGNLVKNEMNYSDLPAPFINTRNRPLVYITLGGGATHLGNHNFFGILNEALKNAKWITVVSTGNVFNSSDLSPNLKNVYYYNWIPGSDAIKKSDGVFYHGGYGTSMEVVFNGKPSIILPFHSEQESNGRRLEQNSAAIVLKRTISEKSRKLLHFKWSFGTYSFWVEPINYESPKIIHEKITQIIEDSRIKKGAKYLQSCMKKYQGVTTAVHLIQNLV